ncbi:DUF2306 domain-containing protein [Planktotalea sp.]|uniref:DUF2306 domain-containing protein n=1 Tax=Planktotalea sp. TaxID=2029877 RepID=UPI003298889C
MLAIKFLRNSLFWLTCSLIALASYRIVFADIALVMPVMEQHLIRPFALYGHVFLAPVALLVLPFQFWTKFRQRRLHLHRLLGRIYVVAVFISGLCSIWLALTTQSGVLAAWGFGALGVLWLATTAMALVKVRGGDIKAHQLWMIRSGALTFAAVTLRLQLPIGIGVWGFENAYPVIAWSCWVPNLIVAEWIVRTQQASR